ncbi:MAG: SDR family oxidoreductase [Planctomycetota bacterium]
MHITIFGASGSVGRHLVQQALDAEMEVTAVVRDPSRIAIQNDRLHVSVADAAIDDHRLRDAIRGRSAVVVALGDGMRGRIRHEGTRNVISAMREVGVDRLICQSTLGAGDSAANLNWLWRLVFWVPLRKAMADHVRQEQCVRDSGLDWTVVRPAAFTDGERTRRYRHGFGSVAQGLALKISRADVADFMVRQLGSAEYLRATPALSY